MDGLPVLLKVYEEPPVEVEICFFLPRARCPTDLGSFNAASPQYPTTECCGPDTKTSRGHGLQERTSCATTQVGDRCANVLRN